MDLITLIVLFAVCWAVALRPTRVQVPVEPDPDLSAGSPEFMEADDE